MTYHNKLKGITSLALCWSLMIAATVVAQAQEANKRKEPITIGTAMRIDSEILEEERRILVHLPDGYETAQGARYPVLYLLDGETHFHHVSGMVDFLSGIYRIPPMIVVGVTNTDRNRDMTPPAERAGMTIPRPFGERGDSLNVPMPTAGGADNFLRFLTDELAPWVETEYRAAPFRILAGHSFGGLFTVHAFMTRPESFQAYLAISPSLFWDDRALVWKARKSLDSLSLKSRFLYMTMGDREAGDMIGTLRAFASALEHADPEGLRWWYKIMPDESHPSVVHRTVYDGLETIFERYRVTEQRLISGNLPAVEKHFAEASEFYGYDISAPEQLVNTMGYMQLQFGQKPEKAVEIFRRNTELYPESANAFDSLGDGYSAAGRHVDAKESYTQAVWLAEQQDHPNLGTYRKKLQRMTKQSEQGNEKESGN